MSFIKSVMAIFRAPKFDIETGKLEWETKHYPCGCTATGTAKLPEYCPEHSKQAFNMDTMV